MGDSNKSPITPGEIENSRQPPSGIIGPVAIPHLLAADPQSNVDATHERALAYVDGLVEQLRRSPHYGKGVPEFAANTLQESILKTIAENLQGDGSFAEAISRVVTAKSCEEHLAPEEAVLFSFLMIEFPDAGTAKAYDCMLNGVGDDDPILGPVLNSWKANRLPETDSLRRLRESSTNAKLKIYFMNDDELRAHKAAESVNRAAGALQPSGPPQPPNQVITKVENAESIDEVHNRLSRTKHRF